MTITDLSGRWEVCLDENKTDALPQKYPDRINLPDSTSNAGLGALNTETEYGCLTDLHKFEGYAWFRREVEITPAMSDKNLTLFLERTRKTRVYVDGKQIGEYCSLCTPHRYDLTGLPAGKHELIIRVDNTDYPTGGGHLTSRDTQTNWNGIVGRIELQSYSAYPEYGLCDSRPGQEVASRSRKDKGRALRNRFAPRVRRYAGVRLSGGRVFR